MSPRTHIRTILFDLDGTLLDTAPDLARALNQLLVRRGKQPLSLEKVRDEITNGSPGMLQLAFNIDKSHPDYHELCHEFLEEYAQNISMLTTLYPGMDKVLESLYELGLNWGVVTNKPQELADKLITALDLHERCAVLVGASANRKSKPDPASLQFACDVLKTEPKHCVFIGDAQKDIEAAKRIDMPNIAAMYGYIADHVKPESWAADYYIDKPMDIIDWLQRTA